MKHAVTLATGIFLFLFLAVNQSPAQSMQHGKKMSMKEDKTETTIFGEVVCTDCYMGHGAKGAKHEACAAMCAKSGVQLSILENKTNNLYLAMPEGHGDPNAKVVDYVAQQVKVTGYVIEKGGMKGIQIEKVEKVN